MAIRLINGKKKYLHVYNNEKMGRVRVLDYYPDGMHPTLKNVKGNYYKVQQIEKPFSYGYALEEDLIEDVSSEECGIFVWDKMQENYRTPLVDEDGNLAKFSNVEAANDYLTAKRIGGIVTKLNTEDGKKLIKDFERINADEEEE